MKDTAREAEAGEELSVKQEKVLAALLAEPSLKAAAQAAGVSETTVWRYLQDASFLAEYRAASRQVVEQAVSGLRAALGEAVETLRRNLKCKKPATEIRAAQIIIEQARSAELSELAELIERLEEMLTGQEKGVVKKWG